VFGQIRQTPPLAYEHYQEGSNFSGVSQADLLQSLYLGFQSIRTDLEELAQNVSKERKDSSTIDPMYAAVFEDEIR
jgi:hypothetical protein